MAKENSFDVISEVNFQEIDNSVNNSIKEIRNRYDLKNTGSIIEFDRKNLHINLTAPDEYTLKSILQVLESKVIQRGISPKALKKGKIEEAFGGKVRLIIEVINGIPDDILKAIVKKVKTSRLRVTPKIEGEKIRIFSKKKDTLQETISFIKDLKLDIPIQFTNYR